MKNKDRDGKSNNHQKHITSIYFIKQRKKHVNHTRKDRFDLQKQNRDRVDMCL